MSACDDVQANEYIRRLIRGGSRVETGERSFAAGALSLFGCPARDASVSSFAAVSYLGLTGRRPTRWCLRLDPGHLQPRRSQLYLIAGDLLSVSAAEAASLVADISELYKDRGWSISAPRTDQWFLELPEDPGILTTPIAHAVGKDIDQLLPSGRHAAAWHSMMNEIQMLLHQSTVNAVREEEDRYTINTVWPWGEGDLPSPTNDWQRVWTDEAFTRGLARLGDAALQSVPDGAETLMEDLPIGSSLLVLGDAWSELRRSDPRLACRDSDELEKRWWRPLWSALRGDDLQALTIIDPCWDRVTIRGSDLRRWRRFVQRLTINQ